MYLVVHTAKLACWRRSAVFLVVKARLLVFPQLDYAIGSPHLVKSCDLFWDGVPADHALSGVTVNSHASRVRAHKKTWQCLDEAACEQWIQDRCPAALPDVVSLHAFLFELQSVFDDKLTCAERRRRRLPDCLRETYKRLAECENEAERALLQQQAWTLRKNWVAAFKTRALRDGIIKGKVPVRSKQLFPLTTLLSDDGAPVDDFAKWEIALSDYFGDKWGSNNGQERSVLMQHLARNEGHQLVLPMHVIDKALAVIRRKKKLDHYGISIAALVLLWRAQPSVLRDFLFAFMASTQMVSNMEVHGRVLGKEGSTSGVGKLRVILPLPAVMQIVDAALPFLFEDYLSSLLPIVPECLVAARPFTQVLDVAHGLQLVLEKGLDDHGCAAAAQCDIQQFYDSLPLVLIMLWLSDNGVPWALVTAAIRHQACPLIFMNACAAKAPVRNRCIGGLTGSRVAGMLARIPVESTFIERAHIWRRWGFPLSTDTGDRVVLCCASYVDNCFAVSTNPAGAICILEDLESVLKDKWRLIMKPSSRSHVEARGGNRGSLNEEKWSRHDTLNVLGYLLQDKGSVRSCWVRTR